MTTDDSFEASTARIAPPASRRVRSAVGLVALLAVLGVVAAIVITLLVLVSVIVLNNAL
ncbi:hypothetical protein [Rhabdothermincola salaria]|uniref:hypothetical protein n=1 Tax=Rhabdothermincola salaria TaxID=2903142 RepID=UPI001E2E0428|nr:hypothetical protein [Rhabdothermincola salaria]MCD9625612.1 hypothetical protein [Rhabdothermincola salaria]